MHRIVTRLSPFHWVKQYYELKSLNSPTLKQIIVNSDYIYEQIAESYPRALYKTTVQRNVVPNTFFMRRATQSVAREREGQALNISESTLKLLFAGSGWSRKGLAKVLNALTHVARDWTLAIVGTDKQASVYADRVKDPRLIGRVTFFGVTKLDYSFYRAFDALVLPTDYDPFPNVIAEALSSGLKVVTSSQCGGRDFQSTGDVIVVDSPRDLIAAFETIEVGKRNLGDRAVKYQDLFSQSNLIASMKELLND